MSTEDLFSAIPELRTGIAANCGSRNSFASPLGVNCANRLIAAGLRIFTPDSDGEATPIATQKKRGDKKATHAELAARLAQLVKDEAEAAQEVAAAEAVSAPLKVEFEVCDRRLRYLHERREEGYSVSKEAMLFAYDQRMIAGHQWNPARQRLRDAKAWHERIRKEITKVNKEIGT